MTDIYVSPEGNDLWAGTEDSPFRTILRAVEEQENGDRVILEDGVHQVEVPVRIDGIVQGQLLSRNRGQAIVQALNVSDPGGVITLIDCENYVCDSFFMRPPPSIEVPDGEEFSNIPVSLLRVENGRGNLITNVRFEYWDVVGVRSYWDLSAFSSTGCPGLSLRSIEVEGIRVSYRISDFPDFVPGGSLSGINILNSGSCSISGVKISDLHGVNASVVGILMGLDPIAEIGDKIRMSGIRIFDLHAKGEAVFDEGGNVLSSEGLDYVWGVGVIGAADGTDFELTDAAVYRVTSEHDNTEAGPSLTSGYSFLGARDTRLRRVVAYRTDLGILAQLIGVASTWDGITVSHCQQGLVVSPFTEDPIRIVARNVSLSDLDVGIVAYGPGTVGEPGSPGGGSAFVDVDYLNIWQVSDFFLVPGSNSPATHFQRGDNFSQRRPRFKNPPLADGTELGEIDFSLELISPLINSGGDI